jgi:hypothetical protein
LRHQIHTDAQGDSWFDELVDGVTDGARECEFPRDPRAIPAIVTLFLAITVVLICIYFISVAPALLAELVAEGGLVAWLYRPKRFGPESRWLTVAIEQTGVAAVALAAAYLGCGIVFQLWAPDATSIVEVWQSR